MSLPVDYQSPAKPRRRTDEVRLLLFAVLAVTGTVDFTRGVGGGGITGLGAFTLLGCGAAWAIWLSRPYLPSSLIKPLLPLIMFEVYATGSMAWYSPGPKGLQLLAVLLAFLGIILVAARETDRDPAFAHTLQKALLISSSMGVMLYFLAVAQGGLAADGMVNARPFALYAMIAVAVAVARWRAGGESKYLLWGAIVVLSVFVSLSRTALVACVILFPMGIALRLNRKSLATALVLLVVAGAAFVTAVLTYRPLYDRFFGYDVAMSVGGVGINASGRTKMWGILIDALGKDWVFGKGIAASGNLIDDYFSNLGHPHNDYLRFYYDLGIVGLSMFVAFIFSFLWHGFKSLRRSIQDRSADYPLHTAALMSLIAVMGAMATDNPVDYSFVMMPLAVLIGCSLGGGRAHARLAHNARAAAPPAAPVEPMAEPVYLPEPPRRPARWGSRNLPALSDSR